MIANIKKGNNFILPATAVAGRMKLLPFFMFAIILTGFIYPIQGYWNWGGGWLSAGGYSDYAGSGTVHLCGAAAALAVVTVLGPRKGKYSAEYLPFLGPRTVTTARAAAAPHRCTVPDPA